MHLFMDTHTRTRTHIYIYCTAVWAEATGVFRGERDGDDEGCLKSTKDLYRQSHDTLRKPKSALAFISDTKREAVEKSWANFAESLRQKTKKLQCISYSKWTFHMRIDGKLDFFYPLVEANQIPIYLYSVCALKVKHVLEHSTDLMSCCTHLIIKPVLFEVIRYKSCNISMMLRFKYLHLSLKELARR